MLDVIERNRDRIAELCRRHGIRQLDLFGSAARGDFDATKSDLDFFYEFDPADNACVADRYFGLVRTWEATFGYKVDLVSIKDAKNPYFLEVANRYRVSLYAA